MKKISVNLVVLAVAVLGVSCQVPDNRTSCNRTEEPCTEDKDCCAYHCVKPCRFAKTGYCEVTEQILTKMFYNGEVDSPTCAYIKDKFMKPSNSQYRNDSDVLYASHSTLATNTRVDVSYFDKHVIVTISDQPTRNRSDGILYLSEKAALALGLDNNTRANCGTDVLESNIYLDYAKFLVSIAPIIALCTTMFIYSN